MPKHPLRAWREEQPEKVTQKHLAALLGVSQTLIADVERGKREPSLGVALRLEEITGLHPRAFARTKSEENKDG